MNGAAVAKVALFEIGENRQLRIIGMGSVDIVDLAEGWNGLLAEGFERVMVEQVGVGFEMNNASGRGNVAVDTEEARGCEATFPAGVFGEWVGKCDPNFLDFAGCEVGLKVLDLNAQKADVR